MALCVRNRTMLINSFVVIYIFGLDIFYAGTVYFLTDVILFSALMNVNIYKLVNKCRHIIFSNEF